MGSAQVIPFTAYNPPYDLVRLANAKGVELYHVCEDILREAGPEGLNYFIQRQARILDNVRGECAI